MPSDPREVKLLKYACYALIFILSSITIWNSLSVINLPDNYVRLERYQHDSELNQCSLERIELKLDRLIMK